jgi:hypothetical protein
MHGIIAEQVDSAALIAKEVDSAMGHLPYSRHESPRGRPRKTARGRCAALCGLLCRASVWKFLLALFFVAAACVNLALMAQFRSGFQRAMDTMGEARRFIHVIRTFMCYQERILTPDECAKF